MNPTIEKKFNLRSNDDTIFTVPISIAKMFGIVKTLIDDLGLDATDKDLDQEPIQLSISTTVLETIIHFCTHYKGTPMELSPDSREKIRWDDITGWDKKFLDQDTIIPNRPLTMDLNSKVKLLKGALYLHIPVLSDLVSKNIAHMIRGKSPDYIRDLLGLDNDFTPEEEYAVKTKNSWVNSVQRL